MGSTIAVILGVFLAALDIHPLSSIVLMTASALWFGVGISWKEYAIVPLIYVPLVLVS